MIYKSAACFVCRKTFDYQAVKGAPIHPACPKCSNAIRGQLAKKQSLLDKQKATTARAEP